MATVLLVSLIFGVCYLFTRPIFSTRWALFGFRQLFLSGVELLMVGYVVGPRGLGLIPAALLESLDPVLHLAVGWAGLIFGLQFNRRAVGMYKLRRYALAFGQAIVTAVVAAALGTWTVAALFPDADRTMLIRVALLVAVTAAGTSPSSLHYFSRLFGIQGRVNRLLKFIVAVDGIPPVVMLGLFAGLLHVSAETALGGVSWFLIATGLGVVLGLLLAALVALDFSRDELLLFVFGMVVFAGGMAHYLQISATWMTFVMGLTVANVAWDREAVHKTAAYAEKPVYLTLVVLAGATMVLDDTRVVTLGFALVLWRLLGKWIGNVPWKWLGSEPEARSSALGLTLLSQGGWAIVLAMDFGFLFRGDPLRATMTESVISAVLVAVMINEVLSPVFIRGVFPWVTGESWTELTDPGKARPTGDAP